MVEVLWLLETGWAKQLRTSAPQTKRSKERTSTSNVFWSHHQMARRSGDGCPNCVCNLVTSLITCSVTCSVEPPFELVQQLLLRHATVGRTYFFRMLGPFCFPIPSTSRVLNNQRRHNLAQLRLAAVDTFQPCNVIPPDIDFASPTL